MSIKNLLVAFNASGTAEAALRAAIAMQRKYDAHITGLLAHQGTRELFGNKPWVSDDVRRIIARSVQEDEAKVEARFRALTADAPPDKVHWISLSGEPDSTVAQYACLYDLTLAGRHMADDTVDASLHPERIALKSGRPVLVLPSDFDETALTRRAVLAWDGRRAAARALSDAMLILETRHSVDVLSIGDDVRAPLKGADVATALARHGVAVNRVRRKQTARNHGADILAYCREVDAGLLVMGAFEHSVFREELFGGTTRHVLENLHIPLLISH